MYRIDNEFNGVMLLFSVKEKKIELDQQYMKLIWLWVGLLATFHFVGVLGEKYYTVLEINSFIYHHTYLEFISIIISFMIFIVTYYTYDKNKRARLLIFFPMFFIVGMIDFFHTMVYEGMTGFFVESNAPMATTFWIIGRLIFAMGMLGAALVPYQLKTNYKRVYFVLVSIGVSGLVFYLVAYQIHLFPALFIEGQGLTPLKVVLEYFIMALMIGAIFLYMRDYQKTKNLVFIYVIAGLSFGIFAEASFTLYKSVHDTYNFMGHIYKAISSYLIFKGIFIYNLDAPYLKLAEARTKLIEYTENLEEIVEESTQEVKKVNEKVLEDLEYARRIQQSLLPEKELLIDGIAFSSEYIPCSNLSGDLYDVYKINDDCIGIFIADVAGHGVSAALMTMFIERVLVSDTINTIQGIEDSCEKPLMNLYNVFNESDFPDEMHIAVFNAIYHIPTKTLSYCTAGMNSVPMVVRNSGEVEMLDQSQGFPICKLGDFFHPQYVKAEARLEEGDRIFFYTDGLVENFKSHTLIQENTLKKMLYENKHLLGPELKMKISREICKRTQIEEIEDDITFLIMDILQSKR
ncbi:Stage II sporulation E family protein [Alkaliphilus metalliredigens QYMF]|uniref:Stage II sporulation E family protein n=1 Tax=Alkaliphilus metalliredigens (strain QYMF) TaxID=293826 RepID=A6TM29_ALKMQ|nr:MASE3 domain-containing protein [Alkaliphilus metalliredigens]ABR47247.1 Stage II sporulation E family protein [Alkaliphilus metalliredigens QYMF]